MRIHILGAGALGCTIGGALTLGGSEVTLIHRSEAHVNAINQHGLRMKEGSAERVVRVEAVTRCEGLASADLMIVLVKSFHTEEAITAALPILGEHTAVMSLQNGMGHEDILARVAGASRVLAGKTYVGGVMLGPGQVMIGTRGKLTDLGELDGSISQRAVAIAAEFERAGLTARVSDNIVGKIWDKLLINVATGAVSAITGLAYGPLYQLPQIEATALAAVAEAMAVARAAGVRLTVQAPADVWRMAADGLPYEFKTSMLQSLEKGSITEIDFINGAVVCAGQKYGVATPVNQTLVALVKGIEHRMGAK